MQIVATNSYLSSLVSLLKLEQSDKEICISQLKELFERTSREAEHDSESMLVSMMILILIHRLTGKHTVDNLYESKYEIPQIKLFDILIEKFPFVKYSQELVNQKIAQLLSQEEEATLLDIGIGQGTQIINILQKIDRNASLKKLVIIGIEPFTDALDIATQQLESLRKELHFELLFKPIPEYVERVDFSNLKFHSKPLVVNASLALHHIRTTDERRHTIAQIKSIQPMVFFLIEPNVNHFEPDIFQRMVHCHDHFYAIFQVIDRLDISQHEKNALKLFFGREIEDILGKPEKDRFEKHSKASDWIELLRENQFTLDRNLKLDTEESLDVKMSMRPEGYFGFSFEEETVLAVICAN